MNRNDKRYHTLKEHKVSEDGEVCDYRWVQTNSRIDAVVDSINEIKKFLQEISAVQHGQT